VSVSRTLIRKSGLAVVALLLFGAVAIFFGAKLPSSFLPDEDQGYVYINLQLPNSASLERTDQATRQIEAILAKTPGVRYTTSVVGFSLLSYIQSSYNAFFFVTLQPWSDRKDRSQQFQAIKQRLNQELSRLPQGAAFSFRPRPFPAWVLPVALPSCSRIGAVTTFRIWQPTSINS